MEELEKYLQKFPEITDEERETLLTLLPVRKFSKGEILLREGATCTECYFVLKGCVRKYVIDDEKDKTVGFFTEEEAVIDFSIYGTGVPSDHFLICLEDCLLLVGDINTEPEMYKKYPVLESVTRSIIQQDFGKAQLAFSSFITSTPEERYTSLLKSKPELLQRVPQHYLASYLGITPESLSRIRRRVAARQ